MPRALKDELAELHGLLAKAMKNKLSGEVPASASDLNVIRQFLKDNNIEALADKNRDLQELAAALAQADPDEDTLMQ